MRTPQWISGSEGRRRVWHVLATFEVGIALGTLRQTSGSVLPRIAAHAGLNAAALGVAVHGSGP